MWPLKITANKRSAHNSKAWRRCGLIAPIVRPKKKRKFYTVYFLTMASDHTRTLTLALLCDLRLVVSLSYFSSVFWFCLIWFFLYIFKVYARYVFVKLYFSLPFRLQKPRYKRKNPASAQFSIWSKLKAILIANTKVQTDSCFEWASTAPSFFVFLNCLPTKLNAKQGEEEE